MKQQHTSARVFRDTLRSGGQGPAMVVLPMGSFRMGDLEDSFLVWLIDFRNGIFGGHHSGYFSEAMRSRGTGRPVRTVTIDRSIAMGKYPVTFEEYDRFVSATGAERPDDKGWGRGRKPVINVSWYDAKAYAAWLSEQTGKPYRLPSEAEWEYAARAGTRTLYSWGNYIGRYGVNVNYAVWKQWDSDKTSPVGSFKPNLFGLYDVHGNVWEWVEDCWHDNYEGAPTDGSAWTSGGDSGKRVLRGGSWYEYPRDLRSAVRIWAAPSTRGSTNVGGFRLVQDLNP